MTTLHDLNTATANALTNLRALATAIAAARRARLAERALARETVRREAERRRMTARLIEASIANSTPRRH